MDVERAALALSAEAREVTERRLLVLAGDRERGYDALETVLEALPVGIGETTLVGPDDRLRCEHLKTAESGRLLGATRSVVAVDAHATLRPNALGSVVGAVDGGGLLILLAPALEGWPDRRDGFDESLAVPPFGLEDVSGRFRERLVSTLGAHRGVAIADVDRDRLLRDGLTHPTPRLPDEGFELPDDHLFPTAAYDACLTGDQADALAAFESLVEPEPRAVVCEADRGRGKSSALGLAAACFAARGEDVLVTAPAFRNARELFDRAEEFLTELDSTTERPEPGQVDAGDGSVEFRPPEEVVEAAGAGEPDLTFVDEAAAVPVRRLTDLLAADRLAFATTVHGYEGAGRGFSVRFMDRLAESRHDVRELALAEPIRYAAGDPVEAWAGHALELGARPAVGQVVADATPETASYRRLDPDELATDETLLGEAFGLLVLAHYRTEPDDLARVLDAPNLHVRALTHDGHVVAVCLLAREGGLSAEWRAGMYEGERIRGNMIPDVLTSQLRDEEAGRLRGLRVMRIATHHAARSRGLGSLLLRRVREEFGDADWLGTGFGATPELVSFWDENGYGAVHCSTTRNDASGEYSTIMLAPTSEAGRELADRHGARFARRFPAIASDSLSDLDPDVARGLLESIDIDPPALSLSDGEWRIVAGSAYGPGLFDVDPGPFRTLVVRYFLDGRELGLSARERRLLVARVLEAREWAAAADLLGYHSTGQCMRALGDALCPLVDAYGGEAALAVRDRFE
ncbi:tRNA(Met) cytidine acetyltransferase TmcA [Saliphagus infecundisoli]|uniref:tRNA(Met) cytidine acetyltransferase TmcA n=1 Tax=Saliphagus infecundisoli TaxID=1849069 RepID=A0ABD5QF64_9EURY|nr:tRNA(Met) cytidine acetyltransferase TmcA [Saliphagus infecundisoli]